MATTTANPDYTALLTTLAKVQQHDFAILRLSESISPAGSRGDLTYNSDASSAFNSSPSALQADLLHYKARTHAPPSPFLHTANTLPRKRNYSQNSASATSSK